MYGLPGVVAKGSDTIAVELGPKIIRVWDRDSSEDGAQLLEWFTTEMMLYFRSHGRPGILGLHRHRELATYDLFYVGIATAGDSFDRLIKHGHKKRMEILINEPQRHPGSRVSDETFLFLFEVESTGIQTFDEYDDFDDFSLGPLTERKQVVADAEKAFIKMLDPSYNEVKYRNYPAGSDGLHGSGLVRYGYSIAENIIFKTGFATIQGALDPVRGFSNGADAIFIEGDTVKHFVSGVDFPSD